MSLKGIICATEALQIRLKLCSIEPAFLACRTQLRTFLLQGLQLLCMRIMNTSQFARILYIRRNCPQQAAWGQT